MRSSGAASGEIMNRIIARAASGSFEFVVGIGTETFRDGLRLSSFRLAFGVTYGL